MKNLVAGLSPKVIAGSSHTNATAIAAPTSFAERRSLAIVEAYTPLRQAAQRASVRKRLFDVVVASIALAALAPVLALIWLLVRATSPGPGLFWTDRVGMGGRIFSMPKFRTMAVEAPSVSREVLGDAALVHVTPLGRFLRRLSIDELPQLYSIVKGDMSFIGPRPLLPDDPAQIAREQFPDVLEVRPGLSGLSQVRGRNHVSPRRKARLDAFYARSRSGPFDLEIFVRTVAVLVTGRGFL